MASGRLRPPQQMLHIDDFGQQNFAELPLPLIRVDCSRKRRIRSRAADDRPQITPSEPSGS
jgi:hypothetical protein